MDSQDPLDEQLEAYALDQLGPAERTAFDARLRADPALREELAAAMETLAALAFSTPIEPDAQLKARVMAGLAPQGDIRPTRDAVIPIRSASRSRLPLVLGLALAASLALMLKLSLDLQRSNEAARAAGDARNVATRTLAERDSLIAQLTDPNAEVVALATTGHARPVIRAIVNRARRTAILSASLLETLPAGRTYQLWFIVDGKPVPSVTFHSDSTGRAFLRDVALPAGAVAAAAITAEPEGGSPAPTSPVLFVGKLTTE